MTTRSTRRFANDHESHWSPAVVLGLLVLGALGYIAVVPDYVAAPGMNEGSWFALTDQATGAATAQADSAADPANVQTEGIATASESGEHNKRGDFN